MCALPCAGSTTLMTASTLPELRGSGTASIPVMSVATGRLGMSTGLSALLVALGILLVSGLVTIAYIAAGESAPAVRRAGSPAEPRRGAPCRHEASHHTAARIR